MSDQLLSVSGVSKTFGGQVALSNVSLDIRAGEIHALVGSNGSGKSTLIKVLSGFHSPDRTPNLTARCFDEDVDFGDLSWRRNLHFIHQDLALVPTLSTLENLAIGRGFITGGLGRIKWGAERRRTRERLAELGLDLNPDLPVGSLTRAEMAMVAMVRALDGWTNDRGLLILDEPTAALNAPEVVELFRAVRAVAGRGAGVLFVSHRFDEVFGLADRVTVLRDGHVVTTQDANGLDRSRLVSLMIGRELESSLYEEPPPIAGGIVLSVEGLSGRRLRVLDFELQRGEILGMAGLRGSGREEVAGLLFGATARMGGRIKVDGTELTAAHEPADAVHHGLAFVPADRLNAGCIPKLTARENLMLPWLTPVMGKGGRINRRAERREVERWIMSIGLQPPMPERALEQFSGGNQQKIVIAKALRVQPRILVLDEPTQGVDVAAKAAIHKIIADAAREGTGIILCSSEADELVHACDRVLVFRDGAVSAHFGGSDLTERAILTASLADDAAGDVT